MGLSVVSPVSRGTGDMSPLRRGGRRDPSPITGLVAIQHSFQGVNDGFFPVSYFRTCPFSQPKQPCAKRARFSLPPAINNKTCSAAELPVLIGAQHGPWQPAPAPLRGLFTFCFTNFHFQREKPQRGAVTEALAAGWATGT